MTKLKKALIRYNKKVERARKQYKIPMYSYYLTKIFAILDVVGRSKEYLDLAPEVERWYAFCREGSS